MRFYLRLKNREFSDSFQLSWKRVPQLGTQNGKSSVSKLFEFGPGADQGDAVSGVQNPDQMADSNQLAEVGPGQGRTGLKNKHEDFEPHSELHRTPVDV